MKLPLAILAAAACALAPVALGQKQAPPKKLPPKTQAPVPTKGAPQQAPQVGPASSTGGSNRPFVGPNDNCASATAISGSGPFAYDTNGANTDGPPACGNFTADVWYNWTAASTAPVTVDLCSGGSTNTDTEVAVYDTAACVGPLLACNDDSCGLISRVAFNATSGHVYKIRIGGYNGNTGTGTFTVTAAPPPPANDLCSAPTVIAGSGPFPWSNIAALTDGGVENCGTPNQDVWYRWTAPSTSNYVVSLCGATSTDTVLAVYAGAGCPVAGSAIACDDDLCSFAGPSQATFSATSGSVYMIRIGGYNGAEGSGTFTIAPPPPPPPNDLCSAPTSISGNGPFPWSNLSAATDGGAESCGTPDQDVWFSWVAPSTGNFNVSLCAGSTTDTVIAVYAGAGCPIAGTAIACNDDFCYAYGPSQVTIAVTNGSTYMVRIGGWQTAEGSGTFTIAPPPPPPANDDCSTPIALSGSGPFPFDTTTATTGSQGQGEAICNFFNTTSIDNDIWFTWTATATGLANVSTCGQASYDSKIAVYPGAGCPTSSAIACSDDACSSLQSAACFPATNGQTYTIQLGSYPTALGGAGNLSITITSGGSACQYDDGTDEDALGFTSGGDMVWVQSFGSGGSTTVSNVQLAYGSAAFPGSSPPNGSAVRVAIWDDPTDDGDPSDAVLLQVVNTTVANVDTDVMNTVAITPVAVNGVFFVGASEAHTAGQFVAPMDTNSCLSLGHQWVWGNFGTTTPADLANPLNNLQQPESLSSINSPCNLLVRAGCNASPLTPFCLPGQNGVHVCPCSNPPAGNGLGCNNFGAGPADSATLSGAGNANLAADTLVFTSTGENNTSFTIFAQGTTQIAAGVVFGAGVRCVGGTLKRLYSGNAVGGTIVRPHAGDPPVHVRSAALGYVINPGVTLYYFAYYRDPSASGPCGSSTATFNSTQAGSVTWQ